MSYPSEARHVSHATFLASALEPMRVQLTARLSRYRHYRRTVDELSWLSDRDLADLGIARADIRALAHETAYGQP